MPWMIPAAIAGGSMLMQHMQNKDTQKRNEAQGMAAAEQTRYSPWSGQGYGKHTPEAEGSVLGAGLQGALLGASFGGMGAGSAAQSGSVAMNTASGAQPMSNSAGQMMNSTQDAFQMGKQMQNPSFSPYSRSSQLYS